MANNISPAGPFTKRKKLSFMPNSLKSLSKSLSFSHSSVRGQHKKDSHDIHALTYAN